MPFEGNSIMNGSISNVVGTSEVVYLFGFLVVVTAARHVWNVIK